MSIRAWRFFPIDYSSNGDERLIVPGKTLTVNCKTFSFLTGLHASRRIIDALDLAEEPIVCYVEIGGHIIDGPSVTVSEGPKQTVCTQMRILWVADASECLRRYSRRCALDVIDMWDAPDIAKRYLCAGDESILGQAREAVIEDMGKEEVTAARLAGLLAPADGMRIMAREAAFRAMTMDYTPIEMVHKTLSSVRQAVYYSKQRAEKISERHNRRLASMISSLPRLRELDGYLKGKPESKKTSQGEGILSNKVKTLEAKLAEMEVKIEQLQQQLEDGIPEKEQ